MLKRYFVKERIIEVLQKTWDGVCTVARASGAYQPSYITRASRLAKDGLGSSSRPVKGKCLASSSTPKDAHSHRVTVLDDDEDEDDFGGDRLMIIMT